MIGRAPWLFLLLAFPAWSYAQSALERTEQQFSTARDSLLITELLIEAQRSTLLTEMRHLDCDSTWLWHLVERAMVLRAELRAPLDTLLAKNSTQLDADPQTALYKDLSAQDAGKLIHAQFGVIHAEMLLLCPDASCRQELETQEQALFRGLSPEEWGIHSFYRVAPFALEPVLLSYVVRVENMVSTVVRSLHRTCLHMRE